MQPLADSASAQYDGADRKIQSLDAAGNASAWELDARGNPVHITAGARLAINIGMKP